MAAWINFLVLIFSSFLFVLLYAVSVSPAFFENQWGGIAYKRCGAIRIWSMVFMVVVCSNYVVFRFHPPPVEQFVPLSFPWPWWISISMAAAIGIPSLSLMIKGMMDAGSEMAIPSKSQKMYKGIYSKIRHPQAAGEVFLFMVIAFACHSPFLAILSLLWFPAFYIMSLAEEKDLVLRFGDDYVQYRNNVGMFWPRKPKYRD